MQGNLGRQAISQVNQRAARVCGDIVRQAEKDLEISRALAAEIVGHCMAFPGPLFTIPNCLRWKRDGLYSEPKARRGSSQVKLTDYHGFRLSCYSNRRCEL